ncbi:alkene reductase [Massilia sp. W12]|uniref:alkene reductase n=1 Tax=Massilia sp. W12 TaxID=3126507 RepID=UPI0030D5235A
MSTLFSPFQLGALQLSNRIVMAPLTRSRAQAGDVPGPHAAEYYAQRASAGLIIAEATQVSAQAKGYAWTPGVYSPEQVAGWRQVTQAVHAAGGKIFLQIWHVGRVSHPSLQPGNALPVAPSAIAPDGNAFTEQGFQPFVTPRALEAAEIPAIINDFRHAAAMAREAGFDGVEVHGANGYLLDQFMRDGSNQRQDEWGGSIQNRARLLLAVVDAAAEAIGAGRVGVRLSPVSPGNSMSDSNPQALFNYVAQELGRRGLAYLHVIEGATGGSRDADFDWSALKQAFGGVYIANNGYGRAMAEQKLAEGQADLIAFGRPFIANPDLVSRLAQNAPLAAFDPATLYGGGAHGYTDYPPLAA